jgi:eukaryotic-like serine/threonine-protein kinase
VSLSIGHHIGPYEIVGVLGAGGMGEVYRAHDRKLKRDVAIKIVQPASSDDRLARFDREAQVLASLNHPNIAHIHGFEESGDLRAIVMELVDGPTLAELLAAGALPIETALSFARQIADAIEAAHDKGIVHRDLKPANIKITDQRTAKVLDFGLAKVACDEAPADLSQTPTMGATMAGAVLGTAPYMCPEQARGHAVGEQADIWSFGCVLYELLSGRRAFDGNTASDAIAAILARDPDWSALPAATPPGIRRLLERCLDKDAKRRLHDIADARVEISSRPANSSACAPWSSAASTSAATISW